MKVIAGLFVFFGVLGVVLYYFGGLAGYDPAEQAEQFSKDVKAGMSWRQVLDVREPKTWAVLDYSNDLDMDGRSSPRKFKVDAFTAMMQNNQAPIDGFIFEYVFDASNAFDVTFDQAGTVLAVDEALTSQDLLNGKLTP